MATSVGIRDGLAVCGQRRTLKQVQWSRFDPMVNEVLPSIVPDGFIYLRAAPEDCNSRMALRNRSE